MAVPGVQLLDVAGPLDVFAEANTQTGSKVYDLRVVGAEPGPIVTSAGTRLMPDLVAGRDACIFDTLLVAGAPHIVDEAPDERLLDWLRDQAKRTRRIGSVCSGAWMLAAAGLLDGRRITTHWDVADRLTERFPEVIVEVDALHVSDGPVRTSAGVTAGLDLALALVEEDAGREAAKSVSAQLVMFFKRPGGQLQFSRRGEIHPAGRSSLQEVQRWALANLAADLETQVLAERAGLSARHFVRLFQAEIGLTPATWVEMARVETARQVLEAGDPPKKAAGEAGFRDIDTFRRAFVRQVGVTPAEYRRRHEAPAVEQTPTRRNRLDGDNLL
ncbi:MAG TPA: DJ-1/PfpI family protein [Caulobacteraceae bacterium]|nr:DJ-1/PfpI family protein [Caulobacteraceae bacterium]